jgi:multiple sugar transport system substrate-binding protein
MFNKLSIISLSFTLIIVLLVFPSFALEIEWQTWGRPGEINSFKETIAKFEELNPDIRVKLSEYSWDDHHKTLDLRLAGGTSPDIYRTIYPFFNRYRETGFAAELSKYFPENYWERFWPVLVAFVVQEGGFYAVPQMTDTHVVFVNSDAFKTAGLNTPTSIEEAWTWEDWENIGSSIKEKTTLPYGIAGAMYDGGPWFINTWGGGFCTSDQKSPDVNKPEVVEGLKLQKKWLDEGLEPKSTLFMRTDSHEQMYAMGQIGAIYSGIWVLSWLFDQIGDSFEWDVTYCPKGPAGFSTHLGGCLNAVSSQSKNQAEAAKFLEFLNDDKNMNRYCHEGFIPAAIDVANNIVFENPNVNKVMQVAIRQYAEIPEIIPIQYLLKNYSAMMQANIDIIGPGLLGEISIEEAVANFEKELVKLLE